jgi:hypothetical protein
MQVTQVYSGLDLIKAPHTTLMLSKEVRFLLTKGTPEFAVCEACSEHAEENKYIIRVYNDTAYVTLGITLIWTLPVVQYSKVHDVSETGCFHFQVRGQTVTEVSSF